MAIPNSKASLKSWCKRKLGHPVIEINVDEDQIDDRIDEALDYFSQYHFDGVERMYLKYQVTAEDVSRAGSNDTTNVTDTLDGIRLEESIGGIVQLEDTGNVISESSTTAIWKESKNYIPVPDTVISVLNIFPFSDRGGLNMFDVRYQLRLNDLYDFSDTSVIHYEMTMQHLDFLDHILVGEKPIRFNMHQNRLYVDMDWGEDIDVGEYLVIECYRKLDPALWTDIYNDFFLKRYAAALIKKQWGQNLIKFNGVTMLGGVTINGETIYAQAQEEIDKLEEEMRLTWEMPIDFAVG